MWTGQSFTRGLNPSLATAQGGEKKILGILHYRNQLSKSDNLILFSP